MIGSMLAVRALSAGYLFGRRCTRRVASVLAAAAIGRRREGRRHCGASNRIGSRTCAPHERAGLVPGSGAAVTGRPGCASETARNVRRRARTAAGGASARGAASRTALDQDCGASCRARASAGTLRDQQG